LLHETVERRHLGK